MAEGGGNDDSDNPFSFKKFMKKQSSADKNKSANQRRQNPDLFPDQEASGGSSNDATAQQRRNTDCE